MNDIRNIRVEFGGQCPQTVIRFHGNLVGANEKFMNQRVYGALDPLHPRYLKHTSRQGTDPADDALLPTSPPYAGPPPQFGWKGLESRQACEFPAKPSGFFGVRQPLDDHLSRQSALQIFAMMEKADDVRLSPEDSTISLPKKLFVIGDKRQRRKVSRLGFGLYRGVNSRCRRVVR